MADADLPQGDVGGTGPGTVPPTVAREMYDKWGSEYPATMKRWGYQTPEHIAQLAKEHSLMGTGGRVLDLAAGDGLSGVALASAGFDGEITAVDLSPKLIELARARNVYTETLVADLNNLPLPFPSAAFRTVVCVGSLTYFAPASGVVEEMVRLVRTYTPARSSRLGSACNVVCY